MIPRYSRPEMTAIWSDETKYSIWLDVELRALDAMAEAGLVPNDSPKKVRTGAVVNVERALEIEEEVKHDVIAFLTSIAEVAGPDARFLHRGMTSSDLLDTAFAVQLARSGELILRGIDTLMDQIKLRAYEFKLTPTIGRSHGIHAEPTTFGLKLASWYAELDRRRDHVAHAIHEVSVGKIAGAVGTYASLNPVIENEVLSGLGLRAETVPTQIVHRDRHAAFFSALAILGSSIERMCVEIRHLQRTEVREVEEGFTKGQKGSSAMPHKKNPVLTENISGLVRLLRGYSLSALENVALWHERDISHSSVERVIAPDACIITDFILGRMTGVVKNLIVHKERMVENLEQTRGLVFSGTLLIRLADKGIAREKAYSIVQQHALAVWEEGGSFQDRIEADADVKKYLTAEELAEIFDISRHFRHVDTIFERTFTS